MHAYAMGLFVGPAKNLSESLTNLLLSKTRVNLAIFLKPGPHSELLLLDLSSQLLFFFSFTFFQVFNREPSAPFD
jgi:hypothetical protein